MARSKLTPETTQAIREALLAGGSIDNACARARIHRATYFDWDAKGRAALEQADYDLEQIPETDRGYADFSDTVTRARHDWEMRSVAEIMRAGIGQPYEKTITTTEQRILRGEKGKADEIVTLTHERVEKGVNYDWRALMELLRCRNPQEYGRITRTEITGAEGAPIELLVSDLAAEALEAVDELEARRLRRTG